MIKNILVFLIITISLFLPGYIYGEDNSAEEWLAGRIGFTDKGKREGIAVLASPERKFFLNKDVLLFKASESAIASFTACLSYSSRTINCC